MSISPNRGARAADRLFPEHDRAPTEFRAPGEWRAPTENVASHPADSVSAGAPDMGSAQSRIELFSGMY